MAKTTCEESRRLSIFWFRKHHYLEGLRAGVVSWNRGGEPTGSISVLVDTTNAFPHVKLTYTWSDRWSDAKEEMDYKIALATSGCHLGGKRYWFVCPLIKNGVACERRVGILYGYGKWFGCRHCLDLAYQSQQESHGPGFLGGLGEFLVMDRKLEERLEKIRVKYWRGQPTKRYARWLAKSDKLPSIAQMALAESELRRRLSKFKE